MNGIEELGSRPDLLDRTLMVALPPIPKHNRMDRKSFWKEFEADRPRLFGAVLDAVSLAFKDHEKVALPSLERMADFMQWAAAASPAFGGQELFLRAYQDNVAKLNALALESNPVVDAIKDMINKNEGPWEGNATQLLAKLNDLHMMTMGARSEPRGWPKSARALSGQLRRLSPALLSENISATFQDHGRIWTIAQPQEDIGRRGHRNTRNQNRVTEM